VPRGKKIDLSKIDLEELREKTTANPGILPFAHTVGGAVVLPEDEGRIKGRAMAAMKEQTDRQLGQLYEQMQTLVKQAQDIKQRVEISKKIYWSQMNFEPVISKEYYLYEKKSGDTVLSMISPKEWGSRLPYQRFVAHVKLLSDHTWDILSSEGL
jgi:transcriptional regulator of heat shock response